MSDSNEPKHIDIDHPQTEPPIEPTPLEQPILAESEISGPEATPAVRRIADYTLNEYPSPAFIKRARISDSASIGCSRGVGSIGGSVWG